MGAEGEFADLAVQYMRVYALCSPVTTIIFAVDNYLRICGFIRGSMLMNIGMSVLSGVLEFLFLGVFHFGIWGAALATCSSMFIWCRYRFYPLFPGKSAAPILQAAVQNGHGTADRRLWKPQLLEQYCGQGDVYFDERDPGAPGR